ncbi:MAG: hypothetical protein WA790_15295 [Sulfitobacter sp.]
MEFLVDFRNAVSEMDVQVGVLSPPPTSKRLNPVHSYFAIEFLAAISRSNFGRIMLRLARNIFVKRSQIRQAIGLTLNYSGTDDQILAAGRIFCEKLAEQCVANNFLFIDMYSHFTRSTGQPDPKWFWDPIHMRQSAVLAVSKEFEQFGIQNFSKP